MAKRKTLGQICGDAFDAARERGLTYPECNEAAAAAVEWEVLRKIKRQRDKAFKTACQKPFADTVELRRLISEIGEGVE